MQHQVAKDKDRKGWENKKEMAPKDGSLTLTKG